MGKILGFVLAGGLLLGGVLNVTVAPQIMTPRTPVFNGPDMAANWEWRSMAIETHGWWLVDQFPDATVTHAEMVIPPDNPEALEVGMELTQWMDQQLGLEVVTELPPYDVTELGIRDQLFGQHKVRGRIHCRSGQEMEVRDTCYYFVAWAPDLLPDDNPHFVGVVTNREQNREEMALVEENLLREISPVPLEELDLLDEGPMP